MFRSIALLALVFAIRFAPFTAPCSAEDISQGVQNWLEPQEWKRDLNEPTLSLGDAGSFDDTHIFAPAVARLDDEYFLWYCGSTGSAHDVAPTRVPGNRIFKMGLATSHDGVHFRKHAANPVFEINDPARSILTPSVLRQTDGTVIRESGKLRVWFTSSDFQGVTGWHMMQEASSVDGIKWSEPSPAQLQKAYAPSVLRTEDRYQMWYTDVSSFPWKIRHARSEDGSSWDVTPEPVLTISQAWEHRVLVYPHVLQVGECYLMWYGSYIDNDRLTTGIGFAVSEDGITWHKHADNPVLRPREDRPWESNYVTSHSVVRLPDGSFRMWYASRKKPPFTNLYFAINSVTWSGPTVEQTAFSRE